MLENVQYYKLYNSGKYISSCTEIRSNKPFILKELKKIIKKEYDSDNSYKDINFVLGTKQEMKDKIYMELSVEYVDNEEGYVIEAIGQEINIYSDSERGLFFGCISLLQMVEKQFLKELLAYDYPTCSVRGVKVYLPPQNEIEYFKQFVDMLCYYKYNTIMIEVGGAMEYKRHPEINEGWVKYCKEMYEYSGKTTEIQEHTFDWIKNSIHAENGGGNYLSQAIVKDLVEYCKDRKLNVIAEVPSLSHCDYLLLGHHDLSERVDDPYPDTYCPSNDKSYELLFDILEEVIEVFEPKMINIGHDEYYSICICDRCKDKNAEEIFINDVKKIKDFLLGFGITTMIWGEKLLDAYLEGFGPCGGAERKIIKGGMCKGIIPPTHNAIKNFPRDVEILHWYWAISEKYDIEYLQRNMKVTYGNFRGEEFSNWKERISKGVSGGIISNWSTVKEENLQRNGILFNLYL